MKEEETSGLNYIRFITNVNLFYERITSLIAKERNSLSSYMFLLLLGTFLAIVSIQVVVVKDIN
jgi:hypothetical protein